MTNIYWTMSQGVRLNSDIEIIKMNDDFSDVNIFPNKNCDSSSK